MTTSFLGLASASQKTSTFPPLFCGLDIANELATDEPATNTPLSDDVRLRRNRRPLNGNHQHD